MKMPVYIKRIEVEDVGKRLPVPSYPSGELEIYKLKEGSIYRMEIKRDRSPKFHDKFFAILRLVVANTEKWESVESLLISLKFALGLVDSIIKLDGTAVIIPRSISFSSMDDFEFDETVYTPALPLLAKAVGCTVQDLEGNFGEYM